MMPTSLNPTVHSTQLNLFNTHEPGFLTFEWRRFLLTCAVVVVLKSHPFLLYHVLRGEPIGGLGFFFDDLPSEL